MEKDMTCPFRGSSNIRIQEGILKARIMSGDGRVTCNIRDLNRTSIMRVGFGPSMPRMVNPTMRDLVRAMIGR